MNERMESDLAAKAIRKPTESHALLHEMIRSFTTLARTLNLSHAVKELGSTRQTLRRHIALLEELKGVELFAVVDRQYRLTAAGERALPEAEDILARGNSWLNRDVGHVGGLEHISKVLPDGWFFHQQERPMGELWSNPRPLFRETLKAWTLAQGELEHEALQHVRPYFMVFRDAPSGWLSVEIGDDAAYVSWFGWSSARSSIGRDVGKMPGGDDFARLITAPFDQVKHTQGLRLDHVLTRLPRVEDGPMVTLSYQRLMLGGTFPDGSFALFSVVERCYDLDIEGVTEEDVRGMPEEMLTPLIPEVLKYERD
ncbi:MAG: LysR family transcriptional regulator [Roseobacter sp.]